MVNASEALKDSSKVIIVMRLKVETGCCQPASHLVNIDATLKGVFLIHVFEDVIHYIGVIHKLSSPDILTF